MNDANANSSQDTDDDDDAVAKAAANTHAFATTNGRASRSKGSRVFVGFLKRVPAFIYILMMFMLMSFFIKDMRVVLVDIGWFKYSWTETLKYISSMLAMFELLKVSHPGNNRAYEVNKMYLTAAVYIVLFTLSLTTNGLIMQLFKNSEFLDLTSVVVVQALLANVFNSRMVSRSMNMNRDEDHHDT